MSAESEGMKMKRRTKKIVVLDHAIEKKSCVRIFIPKDCCNIRFCREKPVRIFGLNARKVTVAESEVKVHHSVELGYTIRDELMIADYDEKGDIIGIELLGSKKAKKPCQG